MSDRDSLGDTSLDKLVSTMKAGASLVTTGSFFAEIVTTLIPNLRIERITTFLKQLDDRVELLEEKEAKRFHKRKVDSEYIALFEDGALHAARSTSEDRIKYNSSAVIHGMTSDHISAVEARHLLGLLNEINDIEMVWLCHFSHKRGIGVPDEYYEKHYDILKPISRERGQADEIYEAAALQDSYKDHLERLKLVRLSQKSHYATKLGKMVLELAGLA